MRGRLRAALVWGWSLLVVACAAGVFFYVLAERSAAEQDHRAQVGGTMLAAAVLVPPALAWTWSHRRSPAGAGTTREQARAAADLLATRMSRAWAREVVDRGIELPGPVRVRWQWADPHLTVPREELNASAPVPTDPPAIPGGPAGQVLSSGLVTRLHDRVYTRLQHGRLVLIGGPGAGKTAAMILLLLEAVSRRAQVEAADRETVPVPVWLTLGSWDPHALGLREWVTATMARDHPYLRASEFGPDAIGALFDTGGVALFLDGLDEMPDARRVAAIQRLQGEAGGLRVVLSSRPDEYRTTLADGAPLSNAAVVDLQPVGVRAAVDYLLADRAEPARQLWSQLTDRLRDEPDGVLAQALNTPLTLSLARTAYPTDPTPLLDPALATEQALRRYLLDQVLVTVYPNRRERDHATYWLGWIAHHANADRDLRWWDIPGWIPRWRRGLVGGVGAGLLGGLGIGLGVGLWFGLRFGMSAGLLYGLSGGPGFGLGFGLVFGLTHKVAAPQTFVLRRPSLHELRAVLAFVLVGVVAGGFGLAFLGGLFDVLVGTYGFRLGFELGFGLGIGIGPVVGLWFGLMDVWTNLAVQSAEATPRSTHRQNAQTQFLVWSVFVFLFGLAIGAGVGLVGGLPGGFAGGFAGAFVGGLVFGRAFGLAGGLLDGAAPALFLAEVVLALEGRGVRFMRLLQTGLGRQVLRQAGAVYQFRHADLQDRLAERFASDHCPL